MAYLYPYGDTQQLNLDWLIEQWNEVKSQIDGSLQAEIDRVEAAITDLLTARDEAVAAQTAAQASAQAAAGSASTASGAASTATAQAQAAAGSAATAGAHASDAQGYAATAQQEAQAANNSASAAAVSEGNARNSETAAAGSSSAAAGNALYAEGYAKGTQNGNPVSSGSPYYENNASYYAGEAGSDALVSEGFAVGEQNGVPVSSGSPYYQNNSKYYSSLSSGVEQLIDEAYSDNTIFIGANNLPHNYTHIRADFSILMLNDMPSFNYIDFRLGIVKSDNTTEQRDINVSYTTSRKDLNINADIYIKNNAVYFAFADKLVEEQLTDAVAISMLRIRLSSNSSSDYGKKFLRVYATNNNIL